MINTGVRAEGQSKPKMADIPLDQVNWITSTDEPVSFQAPAGVSVERAPQGNNIETMLVQGEIDAYMVPRMPSMMWRLGSVSPSSTERRKGVAGLILWPSM